MKAEGTQVCTSHGTPEGGKKTKWRNGLSLDLGPRYAPGPPDSEKLNVQIHLHHLEQEDAEGKYNQLANLENALLRTEHL